MKILLASILLILSDIDVTKISKLNALKAEAEASYKAGNYAKSVELLKEYLQTNPKIDEQALLNLAHAQFMLGNKQEAVKEYEKLVFASDKKIKSISSMQLGTISFKEDNDKDKAIAFYKEALRADPSNEEARYNLEWVKKAQAANQNKEPKNNKDKDKKDNNENKDNQNKDKGDNKDKNNQNQNKSDNDQKGNDEKNKDVNKDGEKNGSDKKGDQNKKDESQKGDKDQKGDKKESNREGKDEEQNKQGKNQKENEKGKQEKDKLVANQEVLNQLGMTDQKAKALLNSMKNAEIQYLQQMKRETDKSKKSNGKPDW